MLKEVNEGESNAKTTKLNKKDAFKNYKKKQQRSVKSKRTSPLIWKITMYIYPGANKAANPSNFQIWCIYIILSTVFFNNWNLQINHIVPFHQQHKFQLYLDWDRLKIVDLLYFTKYVYASWIRSPQICCIFHIKFAFTKTEN